MTRCYLWSLLLLLCAAPGLCAEEIVPLPNTKPLEMQGDIAMQLVEGVDKFLLRKIGETPAIRDKAWPKSFASAAEEQAFLAQKRTRLMNILGVREQRVPFDAPEHIQPIGKPALAGASENFKIIPVRWPTVGDLFAEGLLVQPNSHQAYVADIIAIPDADHTPEQFLGLEPGVLAMLQHARILAQCGCRVLIPAPISRDYQARNARSKMTNREFIYRSAFEMGRHVIGYEVQEVLAAVDWLAKEKGNAARIGVVGHGEGGMIALYAAAIDPRISHAGISGHIAPRENVWSQTIDRNVFGVLNEFGDAELLRLLTGKPTLWCDHYPQLILPSEGGAPATLATPDRAGIERELLRSGLPATSNYQHDPNQPDGFARTVVSRFLGEKEVLLAANKDSMPRRVGDAPLDNKARQARLMHAMDRHTQQLLTESPYVRAEFMKGLDTSTPEKYAQTVEVYREKFKRDVIGWFDDERLPLNPRSRKIIDKEKYAGYEVVLDVWPDVIAYGILLLPKGIKEGEQRPVVVCQHGLEGRPQDIIQGDHYAYHDFAAKLAERGFITFSPQNLYIGKDKFRTLQRKANPLGKTLFSIIIPQHQQIVAWLKTLPEVDGKRIGFYGLSYGGKSAMRIPPLVPEYCLSICSADFNDWVWKNASTRSPYSYVWTNEYEIFEWDLGSTFNYAEMAVLIAPRPFMVERGHFDGVAPDETVGYEFAKVRNLYQARLKLKDRCEIEWFDGPHTINGQGTYKFLHKHLNWPEPQ